MTPAMAKAGEQSSSSMRPSENPRSEYQLVQMRLLRETVDEVGKLQRLLGASNRTDAVARCIHIAALVVDALRQGKKLQLVSEDGSRETLVIPGL